MRGAKLTRTEVWVLSAVVPLLLVILAGLLARRRLGQCVAFSLYAVAVLAAALLTLVRGQGLEAQSYIIGEASLAGLRHLVAVELAFYTFRPFPAARRRLRAFLWAMSLALLAAPLLALTGTMDARGLWVTVLPPMAYAALCLFSGLGALVLWYRLPLESFHKAVLMGFVPYLLIFTLILNTAKELGPDYRTLASHVNSLAYLAMLVFWAYAAWRPKLSAAGTRLRTAAQPAPSSL